MRAECRRVNAYRAFLPAAHVDMRAPGHVSFAARTMAEQPKPKIDLKSRLQKVGPGPGATPVPPAGPSAPGRAPPMRSVAPAVPGSSGSVPPAMPSRPAQPLDPRNPLAAVAQGAFKPSGPMAGVPAPIITSQRIEIDEGAVTQARSSARKQGLVIGLVLAVGAAGVAWVGGTASAQGAGAAARRVHDAHGPRGPIWAKRSQTCSISSTTRCKTARRASYPTASSPTTWARRSRE